ncbi:SMI1/KNR4 family protein [Nocardia cyriacigeorgica]|uniref:Knr4/Smi1-like domain-containing protein n=1 Tax=Nocardia cyriacigeorgica TaxID=135487 RepID=A0A5R8NRK5_9NOCA|nr:SMI1/KNR4 family protein [Nocardia cyriacigeorgica]TLF78208.1 hypothetical protein FEK34_09930 [Nocardia cyriacigeorgica]
MTAMETFEAYTSWLRDNVPLAYENLAPPATPAQLDELEALIGKELPADVRGVLSIHNGQRKTMTASRSAYANPCLPTLSFLSTESIAECWQEWAEVRSASDIEDLQEMGGVLPGAEGRVKPLYTSPGWIPLWSDPREPDYIGLDLDPDEYGIAGQIINFGRNEDQHFLAASSFGELLLILHDEVRTGAWRATQISDGAQMLPWFGDPEEHFFNALYERFEQRSITD